MPQLNRREFLKAGCGAAAVWPVAACVARPFPIRSPHAAIPDHEANTLVNDIHSQLNATRVARRAPIA